MAETPTYFFLDSHDGGLNHIETSPWIFRANQSPGSYIKGQANGENYRT